MPFDPDKYIASKETAFDPDAYLAKKDPSWLKTEIPFIGGEVGEDLIRPTMQALGAVGGGVAGAPLGPVGAVGGAGLGYAGAEEIYKMMGGRPSGTVGEELVKAGENVATGAMMEMGGQAIPPLVSAARKVPGLAKQGISKMMSKPRPVASRVETPGQALDVLKAEGEGLKPNLATDLENLKYAEQGLEPLTPAQMQPKAMGEPTPAQYTEALLKSRDQGLYKQQVDQVEKYTKLLEQYQNKGASTREVAGQQIKEGIKTGKKKAGETIGKFKEAGKDIPLGKKDYGMPIDEVDKFALGNDYNKLVDIDKMYQKAGTIQELDALSSNVGSQVSEASRAGNSNYARKLGDIKTFLEDRIAKTIEGSGVSKPKEAYAAYTAVNKLSKETLSGTLKTGQSKNVINKITASGENIKQFKDVVRKLESPELITTVKENYLSNLFNEATEQYPGKWITKYTKAKKEGIIKELLSPDDIKKIDMLAGYYGKMTSTTTKAVNPSRSGVLGFVERTASQPVKTIVNYVLGDELKYARALSKYRSISASTPGLGIPGKGPALPFPQTTAMEIGKEKQ